MKLFKRQCLTVSLFSLILFLIFSIVYFAAFPLKDWALLWQRQIWHLPFLLVAPALSLLLGFVAGLLSGYGMRQTLLELDDAITDVIQGNAIKKHDQAADHLHSVYTKLNQLAEKLSEQTQTTQKMANETAKLEEQAVQKIISEERNRLARELHDSVSQQLFAASMLMSTINESRANAEDTESNQLRLVEQTIHQSQLEMRALFLHLRPVQLHGKALKMGIEQLLNELRLKVPMSISWTVEPVNLEKGIEDQLFRILQESVSNVLRHAKATKLNVLLLAPENHVILRISDDGVGFNPQTNKPGSYGLANMKERAAQIGGHLKLVSIPGHGTILEVNVPIIKEEKHK